MSWPCEVSGKHPQDLALLPGIRILIGGICIYILLLAVTVLIFKRPVTTELILIVGWGMLAMAEISALYGFGRFSLRTAWVFIALTAIAAVISLICYTLYYKLDSRAGYLDGCVPLIMAGLIMAGISIGIF